MNIVRNKASSITTVCDIIVDEINKDLLRPSDVLALSTYLIKVVISDLVGDNQATIATNKVSSILCSTIANNRKVQNAEAVYGKTI